MGRVERKVALVSGAAQGMGAEHARRLAEEGARVVIADVRDGTSVATELGAGRAHYVHLDVTKLASWEAAVQFALDSFGQLDVLVNNAGIITGGRIDQLTLEDWNRTIAVNLTGVFLGIKAAAPAMRAVGGGSIINVSSTAGLMGFQGVAGYTAAKYGVRGLTKTAALDLARFGIRVNSVHPGVTATPLIDDISVDQSHVAMNRVGQPHEVSNLVLYLASDESSYSTGSEFVVDGGETAGRRVMGTSV